MQIVAAIQLQVVDFAMLTRHEASQLMEFVIPLAAHVGDLQRTLRQPGARSGCWPREVARSMAATALPSLPRRRAI